MTDDHKPLNFLEQIIQRDLAEHKYQQIVTRFPPEPNGYLHIGHAKSICLNFGLAEKFNGRCNLRFDDTNPAKEDQEYVQAIMDDVRWLGFQWDGEVRYASSYFDQLYEWAIYLIKAGKAYVCHLSPEQAREYRGTLTEAGKNSPYRDRSVEENLEWFEKMRSGVLEEGECVLRAKIDMAHGNINMRDPIMYRIRKQSHHQTGDKWCIYPTYDFAHGQGDAIEGVTHSICTLEFADHRPLYEWFIENLPVPAQPHQYEFGRLNLNYTVTSKRKLKLLVDEGYVDGWDDPRMPTIAGFRRRGYTPASIRKFCDMIGVTRADGVVDVAMLEHAIRDDLDKNAPRAMVVLRPLKVVLTNIAEGHTEELTAKGHPHRDDLPDRILPFGREIFIDQDDFREEANKKYKRLVLGKRVRLRNAYVIEAEHVVKDEAGNIVEVHARVIPDTLGKDPEDGNKPKGVIQWVAAHRCLDLEVRLYDRLFTDPAPDAGDKNFLDFINPQSLSVLYGCKGEISLANSEAGKGYQFEREGYFCRDSRSQGLVFNRTISLKDSFGKTED
ncbi:glutamine--tRNA ligase/YqeY domain fusion protein [Saccharophagus sp. K07]|jgi:glutaminyl-tRNA synthetase|uniref:glutamine--tRNA ligase/YqeY domain fusion protein n=1 Tax=Saccharophagus sp. K07 TaxID=2283636 RepID=UPI001651DF94|nr:glutamine--tRNA ligase/YqeY domain fusion protein [Saccharophagus sp. K07]MBC6906892.1 glutamine--tRNA ligase/YqeY domain fusion protein [Saccharophagus sp. K07]